MKFEITEGYEICCKACQQPFWICRRCYRNHRYCSETCRKWSRKDGQRVARRKHQQSLEGKLDHRDRQKAYRDRQMEKSNELRDTVTEQCIEATQSSVQAPIELKSANLEACVCCGSGRFASGRVAYAERNTIGSPEKSTGHGHRNFVRL